MRGGCSNVRSVSYWQTRPTTKRVNRNGPTKSTTCSPTRTCTTLLGLFRVVGILFCSVRVTNSESAICCSWSSTKTRMNVMTKNRLLKRLSRNPLFSVDQNTLKVVPANVNILQKPCILRSIHMWTVKTSFIVGVTLRQWGKTCSMLIITFAYFSWTLSGWTNTIDNGPHLTAIEKVYRDTVWKENCPLFLLPEQKSLAFPKTMVGKFAQKCYLLFDPFSVSFSTTRAYMLVRHHRQRVVSDVSPECFKHGVLQLV